MSRKKFIESHGATCKNHQWKWSLINEDKKFNIFSAWDRDTEDDRAKIFSEEWMYNNKGPKNSGYDQSRGHIRLIEEEGYDLFTSPMVFSETSVLREKFSKLNEKVIVIPNGLDPELWRLRKHRDHSQGEFARKPGGPIRIGYIGTPSHQEDVCMVAGAMNEIKKKYGDKVEIEVIGAFQKHPVKFGNRVGLPKRNDYPSFVDWLFKRVHWDIGIIPLANDDFNRSKSNLKFLEYAALELAIVVSDHPVYANKAQHHYNCLVAENNTKSWVENISHLIESPQTREKLVPNAKKSIDEIGQINLFDEVIEVCS